MMVLLCLSVAGAEVATHQLLVPHLDLLTGKHVLMLMIWLDCFAVNSS